MHMYTRACVCVIIIIYIIIAKGRRYYGDTSPNHNSNYSYRNPTFYYIGTLDPSGILPILYIYICI